MSSEDFLIDIVIDFFSPSIIIVGYDHRFGLDRKGDFLFLKNYERENNYIAMQVKPYKINEDIISSSIIREKIKNKEITLANNYLGWNYEVLGKVVKGKGRGRKINFPTANIEIIEEDLCMPAIGVYGITVKIDGNKYKGMCNIGYRPTFDDLIKPIIEVNIFHIFKDDFYGKIITLIFHKYIRDEKKFDSLSKLISQLELDKENVLK